MHFGISLVLIKLEYEGSLANFILFVIIEIFYINYLYLHSNPKYFEGILSYKNNNYEKIKSFDKASHIPIFHFRYMKLCNSSSVV